MLVSAFAMPAGTVGTNGRLQSKLQETVEAVLAMFVGEDRDVQLEVDDEFIDAIKEELGIVTPTKLAKTMSGYAIVKYSDVKDVDSIAQTIADTATYNFYVTEDGIKEIYIIIDLSENPELFDMEVFRAAVIKIVDRQSEFVPEDETISYNDYHRFAGELYLHMIAYQLVSPFKDVDWLPLASYIYEHVNGAEIDYGENRMPTFIFVVVGYITMEIVSKIQSVYKV